MLYEEFTDQKYSIMYSDLSFEYSMWMNEVFLMLDVRSIGECSDEVLGFHKIAEVNWKPWTSCISGSSFGKIQLQDTVNIGLIWLTRKLWGAYRR